MGIAAIGYSGFAKACMLETRFVSVVLYIYIYVYVYVYMCVYVLNTYIYIYIYIYVHVQNRSGGPEGIESASYGGTMEI